MQGSHSIYGLLGLEPAAECQSKDRENTIVIPRPQFQRDQVCPCSDLGAIRLRLPKLVPLNPHPTQAGTKLFRHCRGSLLISALGRLCSLSPTLSSILSPQSLPVGSTLEEPLIQRKQEERNSEQVQEFCADSSKDCLKNTRECSRVPQNLLQDWLLSPLVDCKCPVPVR